MTYLFGFSTFWFLFITFIIVSAAYYIDTSNKLIYDLQQSTILDPLTGLTNFRHFENAFDAAFNHATLKI